MTKTADLQSIIVLGIDGHLRSNQVGRKIDHGAISPAQSMSFEGLLVFAQKQLGLAEKVYALSRQFFDLPVAEKNRIDGFRQRRLGFADGLLQPLKKRRFGFILPKK